MKKNSFKESLLYWLLKLSIACARYVPIGVLLFFARLAGRVLFYAFARRRRIGYANLKRALGKEYDARALRMILQATYMNMSMSFFEVLKIPQIDARYIKKYVTMETEEKFARYTDGTKGLIFATGHFGNWEIASILCALRGHPLTALVRMQKLTRVNELLNQYRESKGCRIASKGFAVRKLAYALKDNGLIGILGDQDAGKKSPMINLFGTPVSTPRGLAELSIAFKVPVVPAFIARTHGPYHTLTLGDPILGYAHADKEKATHDILTEFNAALERMVRRHPSQWLWMHKRWKSSPYRKIVILDDGKAGHLHQSQAIAQLAQKKRAADGVAEAHTSIEVVPVCYKNRATQLLARLCFYFHRQGHRGIAKLALTKDSYERFARTYADIIISCGSASIPFSIILKKECLAKNICVMKPQGVSISLFDLCVIPAHDHMRAHKSVVITQGVPLREADSEVSRETLEVLRASGTRRIGVLVGGENSRYAMSVDYMRRFFCGLVGYARAHGYTLALTTSRRTPQAIAALMREVCGAYERTTLLVIANEKNIPGVVEAIIAESEVVVVTQDSVSMIAQALAARHPAVVCALERKKEWWSRPSKFEAFVDDMHARGCVKKAGPEDLADVLRDAAAGAPQGQRVIRDDRERIIKALGALV